MELEIENLIRSKIHEADDFSVTWKKDLVWQQIERPAAAKSKRIFYYAAAAILVAGFSTIYVLQVRLNTMMDIRIQDLELSISKKTEKQEKTVVLSPGRELACAVVHIPGFIAKPNIRPTINHQETKIGSSQIEISPTTYPMPSEIKVTQVIETPAEVIAVSDENQLNAPVKVIIGYIPSTKEVTIASKKIKRSRIRFLKSHESEPDYQAAENKWITARIN